MNLISRRHLLAAGTGWAIAGRAVAAPAGTRTAAIIGHTGAGDFGHGMERIFAGIPGIEVVGVADPHEAGRAKAKAASGARRDFADYREMLGEVKPQLVGIGPRWSAEHHAMAVAALETGAHLYLEKPFTLTLAEADDILRLARDRERRVAVAHVTRCAPNVLRLEQALRAGLVGEILEIHAVGKMGSRAGGQDMMVLGLHVFDLVRLFAGDVAWCQARIRYQGRPATLDDARESPVDQVGPVVGDDIFAHFAMESGVNATFRSRAGLETVAGPFGLEILGTGGVVRIQSGAVPSISWLEAPRRTAATRTESWVAWTGGGDPAEDGGIDGLTGYDAAHRRVVRDWLRAIDEGREPLASGERAAKALEMAHGVFRAGLSGERVPFPLEERDHPLSARY